MRKTVLVALKKIILQMKHLRFCNGKLLKYTEGEKGILYHLYIIFF